MSEHIYSTYQEIKCSDTFFPDQDIAVQTPEALAGLRLAYIIVPATGTLIAMAVMSRYDLSEEKAHQIRLELEARRGPGRSASAST